jgi:hypothetical protein
LNFIFILPDGYRFAVLRVFQNDLMDPTQFIITMELVPGRKPFGQSVDVLKGIAADAFSDGRISAVSITGDQIYVVSSGEMQDNTVGSLLGTLANLQLGINCSPPPRDYRRILDR